jgi:hypothetical protein
MKALTVKIPSSVSRHPESYLTHYVWDQFKTIAPELYTRWHQVAGATVIPFFPFSAEASIPDEIKDSQLPYVIWDSFIKTRTVNKYFYPIKSSQVRFRIKGEFSQLMAFRQIMYDILDREDDSAKDANAWAGSNSIAIPSIFFHCTNAFQTGYIESATDSNNFRQQSITDLIVKFDYHQSSVYNQS